MRFKHPPNGALRIKTKFLWFPKRIHTETRWLEKASWLEENQTGSTHAYWTIEDWIPTIKHGRFYEIFVKKQGTSRGVVHALETETWTHPFELKIVFDIMDGWGSTEESIPWPVKGEFNRYEFSEIPRGKLPLYLNLTVTKYGQSILKNVGDPNG